MEAYKDKDPIVLVFGADNGYVKQLAVAIYTCTINIYQGRALDIHVISNNIKKENKIKINEIVKSKNKNKVTWYDVHEFVKDLPVTHKLLNESAYIPFYIPYMLDSDFKHCIYLDCDIIVNEDISKVWDLRDDDVSTKAVRDQWIPTVSSKTGLQNYAELDLSPEQPYFNSGVLLINLESWRKKSIKDKARRYLINNHQHVVLADQDVLNALLSHDWSPLHPRWNVHQHIDTPGWEQASRAWSDGPFKEHLRSTREALRNTAGIVHFAGPDKPWKNPHSHPEGLQWFRYLWESGWFSPLERLQSMARLYPLRAFNALRIRGRSYIHELRQRVQQRFGYG